VAVAAEQENQHRRSAKGQYLKTAKIDCLAPENFVNVLSIVGAKRVCVIRSFSTASQATPA